MLMSLLPFALIFVIMYFLILRPQQKKVKEHAEMVKNIRRGDTVVTSGGLIGKVTKVVDDDQIEVEIADGVRVRLMRQMIGACAPRASRPRKRAEPSQGRAPSRLTPRRYRMLLIFTDVISRVEGARDHADRADRLPVRRSEFFPRKPA